MDRIVEEVIWMNPNRVSGAPCFIGTRLPITTLFEWLSDGRSLSEFSLHWDIPENIARSVLEVAERGLIKNLEAA